MKFTTLPMILIALLMTQGVAMAEDAKPDAKPEDKPMSSPESMMDAGDTRIPTTGASAHLSLGVMLARPGAVRQIATPQKFGANASPSNVAWQLGGGGRILIDNLVIGGKGFGFGYNSKTTDAATLDFYGAGGGMDVGYAVTRDLNHIIYPYIGLGGTAITMELTNHTAQSVNLGGSNVGAGQTKTYDGNFIYGEAGLGGQWLFPSTEGGLMLGFELGATFRLNGGTWEENEEAISGQGKVGYNGAYLRLLIGGGSFFLE